MDVLLSLIISILAFIISGFTFWLTKIKKGTIKMTRPSIICLVGPNGNDNSKIFISSLLYSTSEQGKYVQNMYATVSFKEVSQDFNLWGYGEQNLVRGSGLFINKAGISNYHHFLLPPDSEWRFSQGSFLLEIFVEFPNNKQKKVLHQNLTINEKQVLHLQQNNPVYYNWGSKEKQYIPYSKNRFFVV